MASNKTYIVTKDGEELEQLKTLAAAKKLADAEGAEVYCDGECVYRADIVSDGTTADHDGTTTDTGHTDETAESPGFIESPEDMAETEEAENTETQTTAEEAEKTTEIVTADPIVAEKPKQPFVATPKTEQYRLKKFMNVRTKPSLDAKIKTTKPAGTVVRVLVLENDWLHLADGTFIFYKNGEHAEKISAKS